MSEQIEKIINGVRDTVLSSWNKAIEKTKQDDFMALVEEDKNETTILVMMRSTGLALLKERGIDTEIPALTRMKNPATGPTPESTAIWVVVFHDNVCHVAKMIQVPVNGGTKNVDNN